MPPAIRAVSLKTNQDFTVGKGLEIPYIMGPVCPGPSSPISIRLCKYLSFKSDIVLGKRISDSMAITDSILRVDVSPKTNINRPVSKPYLALLHRNAEISFLDAKVDWKHPFNFAPGIVPNEYCIKALIECGRPSTRAVCSPKHNAWMMALGPFSCKTLDKKIERLSVMRLAIVVRVSITPVGNMP